MSCDIFKKSCEDCPGRPKYICYDVREWVKEQNYNRKRKRSKCFTELKVLIKRIPKLFKKVTWKDYDNREEYK